MEVVFDKGVESIHFIFFEYLNELIKVLDILIEKIRMKLMAY